MIHRQLISPLLWANVTRRLLYPATKRSPFTATKSFEILPTQRCLISFARIHAHQKLPLVSKLNCLSPASSPCNPRDGMGTRLDHDTRNVLMNILYRLMTNPFRGGEGGYIAKKRQPTDKLVMFSYIPLHTRKGVHGFDTKHDSKCVLINVSERKTIPHSFLSVGISIIPGLCMCVGRRKGPLPINGARWSNEKRKPRWT